MTPEAVYLGVDVGSSGTRAVALGPAGEVRAAARRARPRRPMAITDVERTLDVERIWSEVASCVTEVAGQCDEVRSLGVCAMRQTLVVLADDDVVLFASGNDDLRASLHGAAVDASHGDALMRRAGRAPAMIFWPGKLAWLEAEAPEVTARARALTTLEGWIVRQLTGADPIGSVSAAETGARSISDQCWLESVLPTWARPLLPPVADGAGAARLSAQRAQELGLPEGLPVAVGVPDTHAAELGSRQASHPDGDCVTAGWSLTILRPQPAWDANAATWRGLRIGGGYLAESNAGDVASGYAWLDQGPRGRAHQPGASDGLRGGAGNLRDNRRSRHGCGVPRASAPPALCHPYPSPKGCRRARCWPRRCWRTLPLPCGETVSACRRRSRMTRRSD